MATGNRDFAITLSLGDGDGALEPIRLDAHEALSQPFMLSVEVIAKNEVDIQKEIGQQASISCLLDGVHLRYFHGVLIAGNFVSGEKSEGYVYRLTLGPSTYFHEQGSSYRIFQNKTIIDIIKFVLDRCKIKYKVDGSIGTKNRTFCVQYGESDFAFVCRLMEEEGIYYYYKHEAGEHILTLLDSMSKHQDLPAGPFEYNPTSESVAQRDSTGRAFQKAGNFLQTWSQFSGSGGERRVKLVDFDFIEPNEPKKAAVEGQRSHEDEEINISRFPGRYFDVEEGNKLARTVLESRKALRTRYEARSRHAGIQPGFLLDMFNHPNSALDGKYLVVDCRTQLANEQYRSGGIGDETLVDFTVIPQKVPYRAPMVTPRPIARGPETATVTGPPGEEISVDKYGRITIQFHWDWGWDDKDKKDKKDHTSSCQVRVSQFGALGSVNHPRVGEEVLVDFINGNPDRPIVVGRVYNENTRHFLYELPKHKTMAVLRTKTYKKEGFSQPGDAKPVQVDRDCQRGGSEIRIDDDTDNQQVFVYAEKNMDTRVTYCDTLQVGKDQKIEIGKNRNEDVYENETIVIHGKRDEHVKKTETVLVDQERKVTIKATDTLDVTDWIKVKSKTSTITIEAPVSIKLKVGPSEIELTPAGITIKGPAITVDGTATTTVKSPMTTVNGTGMLTLSGGVTKINC